MRERPQEHWSIVGNRITVQAQGISSDVRAVLL